MWFTYFFLLGKKLWEAEIPLFHWVGFEGETTGSPMDICSKICIWILLRPFHEWDQLNYIYYYIYICTIIYSIFVLRSAVYLVSLCLFYLPNASSRGLQGLQGERQAAAAEDLEVRPPGATGERRLTGRPRSGSVGRCARLLGARWDGAMVPWLGPGHFEIFSGNHGKSPQITSVQGCTDIIWKFFEQNQPNSFFIVFSYGHGIVIFSRHGPWASTPSQTRVCLISIWKHLRIHRFIISFPI